MENFCVVKICQLSDNHMLICSKRETFSAGFRLECSKSVYKAVLPCADINHADTDYNAVSLHVFFVGSRIIL